MAHPIDLHVGQRLRQRRRLLGLTQQKLADAVTIRFQQIQKYESGANRVSASRLWSLAKAMEVPVSYFFEGLNGVNGVDGDAEGAVANGANGHGFAEDAPRNFTKTPHDIFNEKETIDLVRAYYNLEVEPRRRLLDLARAMSGDG